MRLFLSLSSAIDGGTKGCEGGPKLILCLFVPGTGAGAVEDEDFSWDLEEDDDVTPSEGAAVEGAAPRSALPSALPSAPSTPHIPAPAELTSVSPQRQPSWASSDQSAKTDQKSPRASSDGASSYDVVGERSGAPSEAGAFVEGVEAVEPKKEGSDGEDSDWE